MRESIFLTKTWYAPSLARQTPSLRPFIDGPADVATGKCRVLLIYPKTSKLRVGLLLAFLIGLTVLVGVAVGVVTKNVQNGAEVSGGMLAIIAITAAYLRWATKQRSG